MPTGFSSNSSSSIIIKNPDTLMTPPVHSISRYGQLPMRSEDQLEGSSPAPDCPTKSALRPRSPGIAAQRRPTWPSTFGRPTYNSLHLSLDIQSAVHKLPPALSPQAAGMGNQDRAYQRGYPTRFGFPQPPPAMNPEYSDHRFQPAPAPAPQESREYPWTLDKALKEKCRLPGSHFVVVSYQNDGNIRVFASAEPKLPQKAVEQLIDRDAYKLLMQQATNPGTPSNPQDHGMGFDSENAQYSAGTGRRSNWARDQRYNPGLTGFGDDEGPPTRKRARASGLRRETIEYMDEDVIPTPTTASSKRAIVISNEKELWDFYDQRLKNCQQNACKLMAKAWIKAVEPKKQSTHPYTGKDERAPDWWPQPWGDTKEEKVRHKEPDHLYKRERLHLLNHILRMIVQPNERQHRDIQKLHLNVAKLEEITNEALSSFFTDKDNPANAKKRPYLKEIFKVAYQEERYRAGQIDPKTKVFVMSDDRIPDGYVSDDEPDYDEDTRDPTPMSSTLSPPPKPDTGAPAPLLPHLHSAAPSPHISTGPFEGSLPVRAQYTPSVLPSGMPSGLPEPGPPHYMETNMPTPSPLHSNPPMSLHHEVYHQDTSRRSSIFATSEYGSPMGTTYPGGAPPWQTSTTAPSNNSTYSFTAPQQPTTPHTQQFVGGLHGLPMAQNQQFIGTGFDEMPRGGHDPNHETIFSHGSIPQPPSSGYGGYMQQTSGSIKMEQHHQRNNMN